MASPGASGSGPRRTAIRGTERTLGETRRAPNGTDPAVVVVTEPIVIVVEEKKRTIVLDPTKDLWVSTVDGRYESAIIPIYVGPDPATFYVHRAILTKYEYFHRALNGPFSEASSQTIRLPEEDPSIFHFIVAFFYEGTFNPIRTLSEALYTPVSKGKARESSTSGGVEIRRNSQDEVIEIDDATIANPNLSSSDSTASLSDSDDSGRSRRFLAARRRRDERLWEERNRKELGRHRPDCSCLQCLTNDRGPPCWNCGMARARPPPPANQPAYWYQPGNAPPPPPGPIHQLYTEYVNGIPHMNGAPQQIPRRPGQPPPPPPPGWIGPQPLRHRTSYDFTPEPRMASEDLRTWNARLNTSVSVYICADKYMIQALKGKVAKDVINSFETAGLQAAMPEVLEECSRLWEACGTTSTDLSQGPTNLLVKSVLARAGFLMQKLWKDEPEKTMEWWARNPECAARIMREMGERREVDTGGALPPMMNTRYLAPIPNGRPPLHPAANARRRRGHLVDD